MEWVLLQSDKWEIIDEWKLQASTVEWRLYQVLQYPQGRALKMDVENLLLGIKAA